MLCKYFLLLYRRIEKIFYIFSYSISLFWLFPLIHRNFLALYNSFVFFMTLVTCTWSISQTNNKTLSPYFLHHFTVSGFIFKSLIHFEFIFVCSMRWMPFYSSVCGYQFSQNHLLKRLSYPILCSWPVAENQLNINWWIYFWTPILFHESICLFLCQYHLFWLQYCKSLQSCRTLWDPIDGIPLGSPVPGILKARTLEWVAISFSDAWKWKMKVKSLSRVRLLATPWTAAHQAPPRQEYWSGVPLPSPLITIAL